MAKIQVPTFETFMNPVLQSLKILGGSGNIEEINNKVVSLLRLTETQLEILHDSEKSNQTEVEYRISWARTYLKKYGLLENSARGIWALTAQGSQIDKVDPIHVKNFVREGLNRKKLEVSTELPQSVEEEITAQDSWREIAIASLLQMSPSGFERLAQRLLRESGFIQVEVTGRSGDGGIDGKGIMRIGGLMSFTVIFQCKRYTGSVTASQVRDFRGAMVGRTDKGLIITTGNFTKEAIQEATRDGAPAIDLLDGDRLIDKLKELSLGIKTEIVQLEKITVDPVWFQTI